MKTILRKRFAAIVAAAPVDLMIVVIGYRRNSGVRRHRNFVVHCIIYRFVAVMYFKNIYLLLKYHITVNNHEPTKLYSYRQMN